MTNYVDEWKNVGLSDNFVFQKVMENPEICKGVLERILGVSLTKVETVTTEKVIEDIYQSKGIRVDAYVADSEGKIYNVEAQTYDRKDVLPKRIRYYQSCIDLNLLLKGNDYSELKDVFIIFICNFDPIGLECSKYKFKNISTDDKRIVLDDGRTIILLNSHGKDYNLNQGLRNLLELFNGNKVEGDDLVDKLDEAFKNIKNRSDCRMEWIRRQCDMQDQRRIGRAEGKAEEKLETARNLLKRKKMTLEEIAEDTGLEINVVKEIADDLAKENRVE